MKSIIFLLILAIILSSCGHFHDDPTLSVWAGGLWIIPWVLAVGSAIFFAISIFKSRSGWKQQTKSGYQYGKEPVPVTKIGQFWFGVALALACIIMIIAVNYAK